MKTEPQQKVHPYEFAEHCEKKELLERKKQVHCER